MLDGDALADFLEFVGGKLADAWEDYRSACASLDRRNEANFKAREKRYNARRAVQMADAGRWYQELGRRAAGRAADARKDAEASFEAAEREGRAPLQSYRFFDTHTYAELNEARAANAQKKIELLERLAAKYKQGVPDKKEARKKAMTVMAAMKKGKHYFALASGASHAEKTRFFVDDQEAENVMTSDESCADACLEAKVLPWVDICSDVIGANSLFPYFLSAAQDSATWDVGGWAMWVNPPFKYFALLVAWLERNVREASSTAAVLLLPVIGVSKDTEFAAMIARNHWALLRVLPLTAPKVFSVRGAAGVYDGQRKAFPTPVQQIGVLRLERTATARPTLREQLDLHVGASIKGVTTRALQPPRTEYQDQFGAPPQQQPLQQQTLQQQPQQQTLQQQPQQQQTLQQP